MQPVVTLSALPAARPPICVIGRQRSGTTVFHHLLASRGCQPLGEVFHPKFAGDPDRFFQFVLDAVASDPATVHPLAFLELWRGFISDLCARHAHSLISFDIKYGGLAYIDADVPGRRNAAIKALADNGCRIVHVVRRNKLRLLISERIAEKTGAYQSTSKAALSLDDRRVPAFPRLTIEHIEREIDTEQKMADLLAPYDPICVTYEAMFSAPSVFRPETIAIANRLTGSTSPDQPDIELSKQNPEPLETLVENYDVLARALGETPHAWMLGDDFGGAPTPTLADPDDWTSEDEVAAATVALGEHRGDFAPPY